MMLRRLSRNLLLSGAALSAICDTAGAAETQAEKPVLQADAQLGTIVVTARRTRENLQETPVAVTALTGEMLDKLNIRDVVATAQFTPNLGMAFTGALRQKPMSKRLCSSARFGPEKNKLATAFQ